MRFLFPCSILCLLIGASCTNYYYLVRHAERQDQSQDSPLSPTGLQRAAMLRDTLRSKHITRIFESQFIRTQQTAAPTQALLGIPPARYNATSPPASGVTDLVSQLRAITGHNVLVVGHSDNISLVIQQLTGESVTIPHDDFDNLFVIKRSRRYNPDRYTLYRRNYGPVSP